MDNIADSKNKWANEYAERILKNYLTWQTQLGVDDHYMQKIKQDLMEDFDDPLKKSLIEATY
ncbi:MAG: hypothetical protein KAR47_04875 [Planctomycetes bacterium]|nr:hypothetical protein [Planctomycetota bacterium]